DFGLAIDGVGRGHAQAIQRYGLVGDRLEFAVAIPPKFTSGPGLLVQASSKSLQPDEPLLPHPLNAGDVIAPDHGCLRFPAGGISLAGSCANQPGPYAFVMATRQAARSCGQLELAVEA